ncbi:hypothetical protein [Oricola indica]|jgi:hypothetical protein|uniref:hypothetical protein n=1 Tax=Oricola indica TaxID=2872591 RepID=UPI001CBE3F8F|nr:hypothetical protein [Oricola indica]
MSSSLLDAVRDTRPPSAEVERELDIQFGADDFPPPRVGLEAVLVFAAMAAAGVAGFALGLMHEGCVIGVCG